MRPAPPRRKRKRAIKKEAGRDARPMRMVGRKLEGAHHPQTRQAHRLDADHGVLHHLQTRQVQLLPAGGASAQVNRTTKTRGAGNGAGLNLEGGGEPASQSAAAAQLPPPTTDRRGPSNSAARGRAHFTGKVSFTKHQTVWEGRGVKPVKRQASPPPPLSRRRQGASRRELGRGKGKARAPRHCVSGRRAISKPRGT